MRKKCGRSTVTVYELDERIFEKANILNFDSANEAWLDFVSNNRSGISKTAEYDLILGPVANDDVYQTFILYSAGIYSKEQTIEALKIKKLYNQLVFTTEIYKCAKDLSGKQVMSLFSRYNVLDYIVNYFEALHTTGEKYIVDDIDMYIATRKYSP